MRGAPARWQVHGFARPRARTRKPDGFGVCWDDEMRMLSHAAPDGIKLFIVLMGYGKLSIFNGVNKFRVRDKRSFVN